MSLLKLEVMNEFSKNAKFALVIGEATGERGSDKRKQWQDFLASVAHSVWPDESTKKIHDNIWLIPLTSGMRFLVQLIDHGRREGILLRILFLDEEPDWIIFPQPEKPKEEP